MRDVRTDAPTQRQNPWQGMSLPLLCVAGGLAAYYLLFGILVDPLSPPSDVLRNANYHFLWEVEGAAAAPAILAVDLNARYAMAIPSVLMTLAFVATLVLAFTLVLPLFGRVASFLAIIAMPVGALIGYTEQYNNPLRASVTNCRPGSGEVFCPLDQAVARAGEAGFFDQRSLDQIKLLTHWNSVISVAAIFLLAICFLFIARRAAPEELVPRLLHARRHALNTTMMLGGLVLVFSVATAHAFYHLAPELMVPKDAESYAALGQAGSTYWGAVYTTVMIVIAVPAEASIQHDIKRATEIALPDGDYKTRQEWRVQHGLSSNLRDMLGPVVAALTPILTAPALNVLKPFLVGAG